MREPLKCWGCGEPHLLRDCPHQNIQMIMRDREATTVNDIVRKARLCYQQFKGKSEHGKGQINQGEIKGKKQKPAYLKNFGRDHQRKKFNKSKESQTAQSQVGSKQLDGDNKK